MSNEKPSDVLAKYIHCYKDKDCTEELIMDAAGKPYLQISKIVDAGSTGSTEIYIINRFEHEFHIENIDALDTDMEIQSESTVLLPNTPIKVNVIFKPNADRTTPLNTYFTIRGRFIIG